MLDISPAQAALVMQLLDARLPGITAMAFGSRVSGWPFRRRSKPYSDLDIALWGMGSNHDLALAHLRADLDDSSLPWQVDLTCADDLSDTLRELVIARGDLLQGQPVRESTRVADFGTHP